MDTIDTGMGDVPETYRAEAECIEMLRSHAERERQTSMDTIDADPDILRRAETPRVIQPTDFLPVTLEARQWETVMQVLADAPYRVAAPLIDGIRSQCMKGE